MYTMRRSRSDRRTSSGARIPSPAWWPGCSAFRRRGVACRLRSQCSPPAAGIWHRRFRNHPILTQLEPTASPGVIVERFRLGVTFELQVIEHAGTLRFKVRAMRICGVPMPAWLWPLLAAEERAERGGFAFDIDIALRGCGRLIRYRGWVQPH